MTMQNNVNFARSFHRRNMYQNEPHAKAFEPELAGPCEIGVTVAVHDSQRQPEVLNLHQRRRLAHIAKMPDLVGAAQSLRQSVGAVVMRVCKNGDPHRRIVARNPGVWQRRTRRP